MSQCDCFSTAMLSVRMKLHTAVDLGQSADIMDIFYGSDDLIQI